MAQIVHIERFVQSLCHRLYGAYINTAVGEEALVQWDILHHTLDEFSIMADDSTTASKAQLTRREVDNIHLTRQEVIDLFWGHIFALCLSGLHEVDIVLQQ